MRRNSAEAVRLLHEQLAAIECTEPLKLLFLLPSREAAERAARVLDVVAGAGFARLVTSGRPQALDTLRHAAHESRSCGIVAVRMITEGFDCPQVSTIAYATNVTAPLFVAQMMARNMRITRGERALDRILPANILIPDRTPLRAAFERALAGVVPADDDIEPEVRFRSTTGFPRFPRYEFQGLSEPRLTSVTSLDQGEQVSAAEVAATRQAVEPIGVPVSFAPRIALGYRRYQPPEE